MSYSLTVVVDEDGKAEVTNASLAPAGTYTISGHVYVPGTAPDYISVMTPQGSVTGTSYMTTQAQKAKESEALPA